MSTPLESPECLRPTEAGRLEIASFIGDQSHSLKEVFRHVCEVSSRALQVERVGIWLFVDNRKAVRCVNLFELSKGEHSEGTILQLADFPRYFGALKLRRAVPAELATSDPRTAELADAYLRPLGISSMLDAAIFCDGDIAGIVCHEHVGPPREWTTEARDFAGSVADLVALKMQYTQVHELKLALRSQEDRIIALEKADALAQMAAGIAHDFNNLLTVVSTHSELLAERTDIPKDARLQSREIADASSRGSALVRELLEFARPNGQTPTAINLADTTQAFLPVLRAAVKSKYEVVFHQPVAVGQVLIDKTQYTRLLLNLVVNARDAMPSGGKIEVKIAPVRASEGGEASSHFVLLEVVDHGMGMDEATQKRIFEPFFTTKAKGTGLGMAIVRRVVDRAGGLIHIISAPNQGTRVQVLFPRVGGSSGATSEFEIPPELLGGKNKP